MAEKKVIIGRIINHKNMIGFKLSFTDKKTAQNYKEKISNILKDDDLKVIEKEGYYDKNGN